ncbi:NAD+ synthase [Candidatus Daviesbacteria bacterium]|nr:NAD+ synthase [Candidatus Daviesbacteria bacterium]
MRIAIAQISTDPGNIEVNSRKIINYIKKAKRLRADMIIFPELAIPGYMSLDLMLHQKFVTENLKALQKISKHTKNILAIVGFIDQDKDKIGPDGTPIRYNSAAIIRNQKAVGFQDKTLLPNYDVFFENRYFSQGRDRKLVNFQGMKLGVQICEDLWDEHYPVKVSADLVKKGADILINISGSPFYLGKRFDREKLVEKISKNKIPFIYVNTVGVQDGYDGELIFDGQSMIFNKTGNLIYLGKQFEEELFLVSTDELIKAEKKYELPLYHVTEELFQGLTLAIKEYFRRTNFTKAFIGMSGGIDSAVVAAIAAASLGKENVTGIYMPSPFSSEASLQDARKVAKNLGISFDVIPIDGLYGNVLKTLEGQFNKLPFDATEENIQARIRGIILMAHANKFEGLVISTANKTETALGYTTLYGDMCGAIAPLADVSKLKVYELANFINRQKELIPKTTIERIPTAELRENQTDEASLGAPYSMISPLVDEIVEEMKTSKQLYKKYPKKTVDHICRLINQNEYKRRQAAPGIKVTKKAFGLGRRIPITHKFSN